jgi:hypothetical protein
MTKALKDFRRGVKKAIEYNHKRGLPAYQIENNYIIALYPGNRKVKLEKLKPLETERFFWL